MKRHFYGVRKIIDDLFSKGKIRIKLLSLGEAPIVWRIEL